MSEQATLPSITKATPAAVVIKRVNDDLVSVLKDATLFGHYYAALEADGKTVGSDVSTQASRARIASFAHRVGSAASAIDKARLAATKQWRDLTKTVNDQGKIVEDKLRHLQQTVRAPLTAWEEKEQARETTCRETIEQMRAATVVAIDDTAEEVRNRLDRIRGINDIDKDVYRELFDLAEATRDKAIETLTAALARIEKAEKDAAELQQLRDQQERDRRAQELRDQQDRDRAAEQMAEANARQREIDLAKERIAANIQWMRDAVKAEYPTWTPDRLIGHYDSVLAHLASFHEQEWGDQIEEARTICAATILAVTAKRTDAVGRKAVEDQQRAEEQRQAGAEAERKRVAAENAAAEGARLARERDRDHRTKINRLAVNALMEFAGLTEPVAVLVVTSIVKGEIPAVRLSY